MPEPEPSRVVRPVSSWRPDDGVLALGVGLAATGLGAGLGIAAERAAVGRGARSPQGEEEGDGRGGPALGSLRSRARLVISGGVPLHVEVDEPAPGTAPGAKRRARRTPTLVLSHGYALNLDSWHYQRLHLRGRYRLVLWDQRGHGHSGTGPEGSSTIDQIGADLGAVIDEIAPTGPLVLLGHSMGGMTVMSLAQQRPELFADRVVGTALLSTSAGGLDELDLGLAGLGRLAVRFAPSAMRVLARTPGLVARSRRLGNDLELMLVRRYSFGSPVPAQLVAFAARMIAETRVEVISDFLPTFSTHDTREALGAIGTGASLVMVGDRDLLIPSAQSEEIATRLPGAEHVLVTDAGHLLPLEHPELVNVHLDAMLARAAALGWSPAKAWARRTVTPIGKQLRPRRTSPGKAP